MSLKSNPEPTKLPLEVMGLILLKLEGNFLEELKKCRLISPRWYKGVQDLFRDELSQKYLTHLNGSKITFANSRSFGYNIFGNIRLNFPTFKISNSEYYLLKTCLNRMILTNLQNLELQDNQLNWKELIQILLKFQNIVKLGFCQTSQSIQVAEKMYKLFQIDFQNYDYKKEEELYLKIQNEIGTLDFLPNLKSVEMYLVHVKISNILSVILSFSPSKIEEFSVKIDQYGLYKSIENCRELGYNHELQMNHLEYLKGSEESLKKFEIIVESNMPGHLNNINSAFSNKLAYLFKFQLSRNIINIFSTPEISKFQKVQKLRVELPTCQITFGQDGLVNYVKNLENLEEFHISSICDQFIYTVDNMENIFEQLITQNEDPKNDVESYLEEFLSLNKGLTFGHQIIDYGFGCITKFAEKLTKLEIILDSSSGSGGGGFIFANIRDIADPSVPVFPNCSELRIEVYLLISNEQINFGLSSIVQKFPSLIKLAIVSCEQFIPKEDGIQLISYCDAQVICSDKCDFNLFQNYEEMKVINAQLVLMDVNDDDEDLVIDLIPTSQEELSQEIFDNGFFALQSEVTIGTIQPEFFQQFENQQPKISNEDLQLIIEHYPNLKELYLDNSSNLTDLGLTGLTEQAIQDRIENSSLSIQPHEISGKPISHLKNLEKLVIKDSIKQSQQQISNISAHFAFENMVHLKYLDLGNNQITAEGFATIRRKSGSENLTIMI